MTAQTRRRGVLLQALSEAALFKRLLDAIDAARTLVENAAGVVEQHVDPDPCRLATPGIIGE